MGARSLSASRGVQGNTANLLKSRQGPDAPRTGTGCKSDTLNLVNTAWVRTNTSGILRVILADDPTNTPVNVYMNAGVASEFVVKRILLTGSEAVAEADVVLLT